MKSALPLSIHPVENCVVLLRPGTRLVAMDVGGATLGLALSTPDWSMVTPLKTIRRAKWAMDLAALDKALKGFGIGGVILGLPLHMDGSEGPSTQRVRQFAKNLADAAPTWLGEPGIITFWDERLSTVNAEDILKNTEQSYKHIKTSGALDAVAAQVILERAITYFLKAAI